MTSRESAMTPELIKQRDELAEKKSKQAYLGDYDNYGEGFKDGFDARDELMSAEIEELKTKPPVFIKLDETTEAFMQLRAAIANMTMLQKERDSLRSEVQGLRQECESMMRVDYWQEKYSDLKRENERLKERVEVLSHGWPAGDILKYQAERDRWKNHAIGLASALEFYVGKRIGQDLDGRITLIFGGLEPATEALAAHQRMMEGK